MGMQNRGDIIGSAVLIFIGIGVVIGSIRLHVGTLSMPQPGFFPLVGGLLLIGLSLILLVQGWLGRGTAPRQPREAFGEWRRPLILVVSMSIYTAVLEAFGYVLPTIAIAAVVLRVLGVTSWKALILTSVGLSVGTYYLFGRIMGIELPAGVLSFLA
jgi:putative tricarboxylic transport membrane protein